VLLLRHDIGAIWSKDAEVGGKQLLQACAEPGGQTYRHVKGLSTSLLHKPPPPPDLETCVHCTLAPALNAS
jgi:hypothetical protein